MASVFLFEKVISAHRSKEVTKKMTCFSLKQVPGEMSKLAWSFRWFLALTLVPLTPLMALLSACSPPPGSMTKNSLYGVAAVSPTDIWAVGNMTSSREATFQGQILIEHWNGRQWQTAPTSLDGSLAGIAAIASNDIWAVGTSLGSLLIMHWNGSRWSQVSNPGDHGRLDSALSAVAAVSAHNVWAVGNLESMPVILHWDGQTWRTAALPASPARRSGVFNALRVISATDIWAVGQYSKPGGGPGYPLAEHWNGQSWKDVPIPEYLPDGSCLCALFSGVTALSSNNVWAVGQVDDPARLTPPRTLLEHWNGTQWEMVALPAQAKTEASYPLNIFAVNAQDIWITGYQSSRASTPSYLSLLHWNGQSWQLATPPAIKDFFCVFYAGTALGGDDLWVVGSCGRAVPPPPDIGDPTAQTLVEHWNGTDWAQVASPSPGQPIMVPAG